MNEETLRSSLREIPLPDEEGAEARGLRVVEAAFAGRPQSPSRSSLPRLAVALAAITLFAALLLSPAGAGVRDWIDEAITVGVSDPRPALTEVPGGGRLLIQSEEGPWVVKPDGSRRLLGSYAEATWSPRGLFVAATEWDSLSAVEPDGTVRWSLSATPPVTVPRWSPSGVRIAYRAAGALRVVAGDGTGDARVGRRAADVPPAWAPHGPHLLAYVREGSVVKGGGLRIVESDSGEVVASGASPPGVTSLAWSSDGSRLLETTPDSIWIRDVAISKLGNRLELGPPRRLTPPGRATVRTASFSPRDGTVAALLTVAAASGLSARSEIVLVDAGGGGPPRQLFSAPGRLSGLAWSPGGDRLLIGWPDADQWLFIPTHGRGQVRAVGGISAEFDPGSEPAEASFPAVEGWCCPALAGG